MFFLFFFLLLLLLLLFFFFIIFFFIHFVFFFLSFQYFRFYVVVVWDESYVTTEYTTDTLDISWQSINTFLRDVVIIIIINVIIIIIIISFFLLFTEFAIKRRRMYIPVSPGIGFVPTQNLFFRNTFLFNTPEPLFLQGSFFLKGRIYLFPLKKKKMFFFFIFHRWTMGYK